MVLESLAGVFVRLHELHTVICSVPASIFSTFVDFRTRSILGLPDS